MVIKTQYVNLHAKAMKGFEVETQDHELNSQHRGGKEGKEGENE